MWLPVQVTVTRCELPLGVRPSVRPSLSLSLSDITSATPQFRVVFATLARTANAIWEFSARKEIRVTLRVTLSYNFCIPRLDYAPWWRRLSLKIVFVDSNHENVPSNRLSYVTWSVSPETVILFWHITKILLQLQIVDTRAL